MLHLDLTKQVWSKSVNSLGTGGCFLKTNYIYSGENYYIKLSDYNTVDGVIGHESVNEVIAYRLAKMLGIECAEQQLIECSVSIDDTILSTYACMSKSYLQKGDKKETFEMFYDMHKEKDENTITFLRRYKQQDFFYKMFIFDYLIYNRDRHGANVELLKNNNEYRFAPLFDNGLSFLFSYHTDEDINNFNVMIDKPVNNYVGYKSLLKNIELIDTKVTLNSLNKTFKSSLFYELFDILTEKHIDTIWNMITQRYEYCVEKGVIIKYD